MKATALTIVDEQDANRPLSIEEILGADNLIELLPEQDVSKIGFRCLQEFEYDLASRRNPSDDSQDWEKRYDRYLDIAMQVRAAKTFPWPGAANIKLPILTTAAVQFQARAYPAIVDGSNLVKGRVLGDDSGVAAKGPDGQPVMQPGEDGQPIPMWEVPPGAKQARADRIGEHMTWQLLYDMKGWEEDTDRLLLMLPIVGCVFRKTWFDQILGRNVSRLITAKDFVVNYWAASIEEAPRFTHILRFYPHEIEERMRTGLWATITLPDGRSEKDDSDTAPIDFLEQCCRLDLDGDGYPEPYVVTVLRESGKVVRIAPCFDAEGVTIINGKVAKIEPKSYFTKYGFIPSPDGAFYDIGFGALLDDITAAIDTVTNQLLDAGALQNAQGGFVGNGVTMKSGNLSFRLGEWKRVDVTGGSLKDNIFPMNLPGPSAVLFNLLEMLISHAKEITSVQDILTGAGQGVNTPATTVLAQIEQATKVMTAIFKRVHRSFSNELRILFGLNRDHLDEKAYYALTDQPGQIGRADYQDKDIDVIPVSDPTMVNDAQKAARAAVLQPFINDPLTNQEEIRRRIFTGTGQPDVEALLKVPPPQPDPKLLLDTMKQHNERDSTLADIRAKDAAAANSLAAAAAALQPIGFEPAVATLAGAAMKMGIDASRQTGMDDGTQTAGQPGGNGPVEEPTGNAGLPPPSPGAEGEPDGSMGVGPALGGGGAGTGGDADQTLEPVA